MKRIVLILAGGLLLTAPGACNCEGEKAPEVEAPEGDPAPDKGAVESASQPADPKKAVKDADSDPGASEGDQADGAKGDKSANETPPSGPASGAAGDDEGAAAGDKAAGDGPGDKLAGADGSDAEEGDGDGPAGTMDTDAIKEAESRDPMDEIEPGGVYVGPPGKAIVGTWELTVSKAGLPGGLPPELEKEVKAIKKVTMRFDGKKATVDLGRGKKNTVDYTVKDDSKITATLTTKAGEDAGSVQVTFLDNDNILINSTSFPVQMKGKRTK